MDWSWSWPYVLLGVAVVLVTGVLVALGVRSLEAQSRRESRASELEVRITGPVSQEPSLRNAAVAATAHVPRRGPVTVEVIGRVPSALARAAALRIAEAETARSFDDYRIVDRLEIAERADRRHSA
jgi:hypothetical protein